MSIGQPHLAFVMEQTLGHVTHYANLRAAIDTDHRVDAAWYPLAFPPRAGLETLPFLRGNWSLRASARALGLLRRDGALAGRYDALFFHTQVTSLLSVGLMRRVPSIVSLDATPINFDMVGAAYGHERGHSSAEAFKRALNKRALRAARRLVTWCEWAKHSLVDDYGIDAGQITVIPPGVRLDTWPRARAQEPGAPRHILFVGGDFARKGGEFLLQAFDDDLRGRCELHLVTKMPLASAPGIHVYTDVAPNSDLLKSLYMTADIFVLPTLADCFPLVLQEAMAASLPVIATDIGANGEAVRNGETGLLVPPGDVCALGAALKALVADPARCRAMGERGRRLAEQRFDSAVNARRIVDLMLELAGS